MEFIKFQEKVREENDQEDPFIFDILNQLKQALITSTIAFRDELFNVIEEFYITAVSWIPKYHEIIIDEVEISFFECFHSDFEFIYQALVCILIIIIIIIII